MRSLLLACVVTLTACAPKPVGPSGASVWRSYPVRSAWGKASAFEPTTAEPVFVGVPFDINGRWSATCVENRYTWYGNHSGDYEPKYSSCQIEDADLVVRCDGPCSVHGTSVTPTGTGTLHVTVDMKSRKSGAIAQLTTKFTAVVPDGFYVEGKRVMGGDEDGDTVEVSTDKPQIMVSVISNGGIYAVPIDVDGVRVPVEDPTRGVPVPASGTTVLSSGSLRRTLTFTKR